MTPVIPEQNCLKCGKDSGTKIVCEDCRIELTASQRQKFDAIFQRTVVELFGNACVDCSHYAETNSGELCADHLDTKGSCGEGRYDLANAVCRCMDCHNKRGSGEIERTPEKRKMPKQTQERAKKSARTKCSGRPFCPLLPLSNGRCIQCQGHRQVPFTKRGASR
jgi:hypothetical protein